ncbi:MAG: type II secretion system protein GspC [Thiotrichales bacterium]
MNSALDLSDWLNAPAVRLLSRRAPPALAALLLIALAWSLAHLIWLFVAPPAPVNHTPRDEPTRLRPVTAPDYASRIGQLDLFGIAAIKSAEVPEDAPETQLNLKLSGIYALRDETRGLALISAGGAAEKLFKVGDTLPGNAKLSAVHPDRVMLERSGRFETLRLPSNTPAAGQSGAARTPAAFTRGAPPAQPTPTQAAPDLAEFRQEMLSNPTRLGQLVAVAPAYENNLFVGYRLTKRQEHPLFDELNLQSGDIVTRVNDLVIDRPEKGIQALQQLSQAQSLSITVNRNGQSFEISHTF